MGKLPKGSGVLFDRQLELLGVHLSIATRFMMEEAMEKAIAKGGIEASEEEEFMPRQIEARRRSQWSGGIGG